MNIPVYIYVLAAAALAIFIIKLLWDWIIKQYRGKAQLTSLLWVEGVLMVSGEVFYWGGKNRSSYAHTRLSVLDTQTGKRLKRKILRWDRYMIRMAVNGIACLEAAHNKKLTGLDVFTLKKIYDEETIKEKLGIPLKQGSRVYDVDAYKGIITMKTDDMQTHDFDCSVYSSASGAKGLVMNPRGYVTTSSTDDFEFSEKPGTHQYQLLYEKNMIDTSAAYYDPCLLQRYTGEKEKIHTAIFYAFDEPETKRNFTIYKTDAIGKMHWSITHHQLGIHILKDRQPALTFAGENEQFFILGIGHSRHDRMVAIDKRTGAIVWQARP